MLVPRQWVRVVGCVFAIFLFVAILYQFGVLDVLPQPLKIPAATSFHDGEFSFSSQPQDGEQQDRSGDKPAIDTLSTADLIAIEENRTLELSIALDTATPSSPSDAPPEDPKADPHSPSFRKTVVMGKLLSEDTEWATQLASDWNSTIYVVDSPQNETSPTGYRTKMNKAKEATPYLTYIVEHYDDFPDVAAFVHAHEKGWPQAWHNDVEDYSAITMIHRLRLDTVLERGYVNLRCNGNPGCPAEIKLQRDPPALDRPVEDAYPIVYGQFFNMSVEEVREQVPIIATPCCAQFAVSRHQVHQRPKAEYERFLTLIEESEYEDHLLGTVMEYMWHILFGRDAVFCEAAQRCYRAVYSKYDY